MSQIITHSNILNPSQIMVMPTYAKNSEEVLKDLLIADGFEVVLSKNSEIMHEPFEIEAGDVINVIFIPQGGGDGKSIISLVAMIGLAIFAPQFVLAQGMFEGIGLNMVAGSLGASLATAGIMMAGSLIINAVLGPSIPTSSLNMDNLETSSAYSWDESYNTFSQGKVIPKVYGTHKIVPPLVSKHIDTVDNKQYFNGLYAVNDGVVTSITDIKINDEPIENFDDVFIDIRYGTNTQTLIPNFDNTRSDKGVSKKLTTDYATAETNGNAVVALTATLMFPRGLFYAADNGGLVENSVKVVLQYSNDNTNWVRFGGDTEITGYWYHEEYDGGDSGGTYIAKYSAYNGTFISYVDSVPPDAIRYTGGSRYDVWYYTPSYDASYTTITGAESSTIRKTFSLNNLTPSRYYIRVKFYEEPTSGTRYGSDCYLEHLTEEVGDDFIYPSTTLIAIRALATDQLSGGSPKVSCVVTTDVSKVLKYDRSGTNHPNLTYGVLTTTRDIKVGVTLDGTQIYSTLQAYDRVIFIYTNFNIDYSSFYFEAGVKYKIEIREVYSIGYARDIYFTPTESGFYGKIIPDGGTPYDGNTDTNVPTEHITGWNPDTDYHTGYTALGDSTKIYSMPYKYEGGNNPSIISQQILTDCGILSDRFLDSFKEWQIFCTEKNHTCNIVFDSSMSVKQALSYVATCGRASVMQFGSKYGVIIDKAYETPVQAFTFGMGNILKDSFKQSFLPILDRANVIEMTYYDAENEYDATIVEVSNTNYDSVAEENRTAITLVGCTNREQAIKHAKYLLNCNRYITETVEIAADKDALVCKYGDIVKVSHDVPEYGFSGRIVYCTTTQVTLDRDVTMVLGTNYYIQVRDSSNNVHEHYVNNSNSTTDVLTFTTPITTPYWEYDNYAFGEVGKASKLYRVMRIGTANDMTRKLSLVEYNKDVYSDEEVIDIPQISSLGLSNLRATDYIRYAKDGSIEEVMQIAWSGQSLSYTVEISYTKSSAFGGRRKVKNSFSSNECVFEYVCTGGRSYDIKVYDTFGGSLQIYYTPLGKFAAPTQITNLTANSSNDLVVLTWDKCFDIDLSHYEVRVNNTRVHTALTNRIELSGLITNNYTFTVHSVDKSGVKSTPTSIIFDYKERSITELIDDAYLIEKAFLDGRLTIYFTAPSTTPDDYDLLVARLGDMTVDEFSYASKQLEGFSFDDFLNNGLTYKYWINSQWNICTKTQLLVIQKLLSYVVTMDASVVGSDGNIRVFNKQPFVPYSIGDLWIDGDTVRVCQTEKLS